MDKRSPKLRTVHKSPPAYELNRFPTNLPFIVGREIVYLLASKGKPNLVGSEWEEIFATSIGAEWRDSNVGLDDVRLGNTAWGAKTVKSTNPSKQKKVQLVSGRNSIVYSFGASIDTSVDPNLPGDQVLSIWNDRVSAIRERFDHLRTIVLIKSNDLSEVVVFEFETIRYDQELFYWEWNKNLNLKGFSKKTNEHMFTWQPHGSQFTIHEKVPSNSVLIKIKKPEGLNKEKTLQALGFDKTWITVSKTHNII
ncbi:MAG: hypothetical protein ABIN91_00805 [Mucilaginibacter sp.]|uniref:hypothetical protein n=1 Tax=Mucilaginibacter sp. TaxID=1882438 RepID=UPI00326762E4